MSMSTASVYNDLQGLTALKAGARTAPADNIAEVAQQFESIFFSMMLKSMRDATIEGDLFSSNQMDTYQQMFDQQLSLDLSHNGGLGLAEILIDQLGQPAADTAQTNPPQAGAGNSTRLDMERQLSSIRSVEATPAPGVARAAPPLAAAGQSAAQPDWAPASPEEYVQSVWEHAVEAAATLGVDPKVLVAQSALETGWGKKVISTADGGSSYNLFGIKAGDNWHGRSAGVNTLEYRDGVAAMERASFRAYDSVADAFQDYARLLKESPRYQPALATGGDDQKFLNGLQQAGYATDPHYADKIMRIVEGGSFTNLVQELKNSVNPSLSG